MSVSVGDKLDDDDKDANDDDNLNAVEGPLGNVRSVTS
jgi:hypothetical protein